MKLEVFMCDLCTKRLERRPDCRQHSVKLSQFGSADRNWCGPASRHIDDICLECAMKIQKCIDGLKRQVIHNIDHVSSYPIVVPVLDEQPVVPLNFEKVMG